MEIFFYLLSLAIFLGFVAAVLALPIIAFVRSRRVVALSQRLDELDEEVRRLRRQVRRLRDAGAPTPEEAEPEPAAEEPAEVTPLPEVLPAETRRRRGP